MIVTKSVNHMDFRICQRDCSLPSLDQKKGLFSRRFQSHDFYVMKTRCSSQGHFESGLSYLYKAWEPEHNLTETNTYVKMLIKPCRVLRQQSQRAQLSQLGFQIDCHECNQGGVQKRLLKKTQQEELKLHISLVFSKEGFDDLLRSPSMSGSLFWNLVFYSLILPLPYFSLISALFIYLWSQN